MSIRSIFFHLQPPHFCLGRAVCVRLFSVGLTLSQIRTATHWRPCLHPPSSAWKSTFSCQRPFQCCLFNLTLFTTSNLRVSGAACGRHSVLGVRSCGFHPWIKLPFSSDCPWPQLTGVRCASITWQVSAHLLIHTFYMWTYRNLRRQHLPEYNRYTKWGYYCLYTNKQEFFEQCAEPRHSFTRKH